jgi:hypothetical protein
MCRRTSPACQNCYPVRRGGAWSRAQTDGADLARRLNPAGFSFAFAGYGELLTATFKSVLLGLADVTGERNLAAQRRSNLL